MNDERDADILALFANAEEGFPDGTFSQAVMARAGKRGRAISLATITIAVLVALAGLMLLAPALQFAALSIGGLLAQPIVASGATPLAQILAPVNTVAVPVGLALLCAWLFARKLFA